MTPILFCEIELCFDCDRLAIGGGEFAEAGYGGGDDFEGFVDLFLGGEAGEGEADAGSGAGGGKAHCSEDVGGFGCTGLASGASADGEGAPGRPLSQQLPGHGGHLAR